MIGQLLVRRYRIIKVLSSSTLGHAYLAEDLHRPGFPLCVVKQLQPPTHNPQALKNAYRLFRKEAETLEYLGKHERIPQLLAYFEEKKQFYLVKEFIPGHPLDEEIVQGQFLPEAEVVSILIEVLEILMFVHGFGVIHRDIKPANLIRRDFDNRLMLIDFGSVKEVSLQVEGDRTQFTRTIAAGTPAYMPIEQFQGNPQFNSDIYALGMIAIQALTGLPATELPKLQDPYSLNPGQIVWRHLAEVKPELGDIIDKMVYYHFGHRYQTAAEVLTDLIKISSQYGLPERPLQPIVPSYPKVTPRLGDKAIFRPQMRLVLLGVTILALVGGLGVAISRELPQTLLAQYFLNRGENQGDDGKHQAAIANYTKAIAFNPDSTEAYYNRAIAYASVGEQDRAIEDLTQTLRRNPKHVKAYVNRGTIRSALGDAKGALADYTQAIQLDPNLAPAYANRGIVYTKLGNDKAAIADYDRAIALDPKLASAYLSRCLARSNLKDQQGAIADCTQAIQLKPNYAYAYQNRGLAKRRVGDIQGAIEDFNVAIGINPEDADPYYNRGLARYALGEKQGTLEDLDRAIALNSTHALAYYDRARVQLSLGNKQKAIEDFNQSAKLCLDRGKLGCYKDAQYQLNKLRK